MASEQTILEVNGLLMAAYPIMQRDTDQMNAARLRVFRAVFADVDDAALKAGTLQLIADRASAFAPSAGELRAKALAIADAAAGTESIDEYEAWGLVSTAMSTPGRDATADELRAYFIRRAGEYRGALIAQACGRIGWREMCLADTSDGLNTLRAQFRNCLAQLQTRERTDRQTLPRVRQITQALAAKLDAARPRQIGSHNE